MGRPKEYNRDELLQKTIQLFWKKGLADTSLTDLEKATGVNKSGLYSEFIDKDDLFVASLIHYAKNSGVLELLSTEPLGKVNIYNFLNHEKTCFGQKGCFAINSIREVAILPDKAKDFISSYIRQIKEKLVFNIEKSNYKGDPKMCADLILTFNAGVSLELNIEQTLAPTKKIDEFFKLLQL